MPGIVALFNLIYLKVKPTIIQI